MHEYTWILTPDLSGVNLEKMHEYDYYDWDHLNSIYFITEMLKYLYNCIDDKSKIEYKYKNLTVKYCWRILFSMSDDICIKVINDLIPFQIGRFKTSNIYKKINNEWKQIYKYKIETNMIMYHFN